MNSNLELQFSLVVDDGWPPVAVEGLPFELSPLGYIATVPPLYIKSLSVGDIISVEFDENGLVEKWHHISKSNNSVIWLLRMARTETIDSILEELNEIGCQAVSLSSVGSYSIGVPDSIPIEKVDEILQKLDPEKVAIAYPSFRHPEESMDPY